MLLHIETDPYGFSKQILQGNLQLPRIVGSACDPSSGRRVDRASRRIEARRIREVESLKPELQARFFGWGEFLE